MFPSPRLLLLLALSSQFPSSQTGSSEAEKLYLTENSDENSEVVLTAADLINAEYLGDVAEQPGLAKEWEEQEKFEGDIEGVNATLIESYVDESNLNVHSSFILPGKTSEEEGEAALKNRHLLWYNATVPYTISSKYSSLARTQIALAFKVFHDNSCVRFVPKTDADEDYISISPDKNSCFSTIGKSYRGGSQTLGLAAGCVASRGIVIHELMHAIGFFHEQSRPDRDGFIEVIRENIREGKESQFRTYGLTILTDLGEDYDLGSIMHYGKYAFTKNGKPTIRPKIEGAEVGQRRSLSAKDIVKINKLYECYERSCNFSGLRYELDSGISGGSLKVVEAKNEDSCCGQCFQHPDCQAFVYDLRNDSCILKSEKGPLVANLDQITGLITRPDESPALEFSLRTTTPETKRIYLGCVGRTECAKEALCFNDSSSPLGYTCQCPQTFLDMGGEALPGRLCIPASPDARSFPACEGQTTCAAEATCRDDSTNILGYTCQCPPNSYDMGGTALPGRLCLSEVNECLDPNLNDCDEDAVCLDLQFGFVCACRPEYFDRGVQNGRGPGTDCIPESVTDSPLGNQDNCEGLTIGGVKETERLWAVCLNNSLVTVGCMKGIERVNEGDHVISEDLRFNEVCWHEFGGLVPVSCLDSGGRTVEAGELAPTFDGFIGICVLDGRTGINITQCIDSEGITRENGEMWEHALLEDGIGIEKRIRCESEARSKIVTSCTWTFPADETSLQPTVVSLHAGCYDLKKGFILRCETSEFYDEDTGLTRLPEGSWELGDPLSTQGVIWLENLDDEGLRTGLDCLLATEESSDQSEGLRPQEIYNKTAVEQFLRSLTPIGKTSNPREGPTILSTPSILDLPGVLSRENRDIEQSLPSPFPALSSVSLEECYRKCEESDACRGISFHNRVCHRKSQIERVVYKAGSVIAIRQDEGFVESGVCEEARKHGICSFAADCVVVEGRATCICPFGFQEVSEERLRHDTGRKCIEVETPCRDGSNDCGPNSICTDFEIGYSCSCIDNFVSFDSDSLGRNCTIPVY